MTDRITEIRARVEAATEGEWDGIPVPPVDVVGGVAKPRHDAPKDEWAYPVSVRFWKDGLRYTRFIARVYHTQGMDISETQANHAFLKSAHADMAYLLSELDAARAENERLRRENDLLRSGAGSVDCFSGNVV